MQVRPVLFTIFIAFGFAILANAWVIGENEMGFFFEEDSLTTASISTVVPDRDDTTRSPEEKPVHLNDTSQVANNIQDLILLTRIKKQLFRNEHLKRFDLGVKVEGGHVEIIGSVSSSITRQRAEAAVKRVSGIKSLTNSVTVND